MGRLEDVGRLKVLLAEATARIDPDYFLLPVATKDETSLVKYWERVYAYELYHQLRVLWLNWHYSLGGEIEKRGHPLVRGPGLDNVKPDLLVHKPRSMNHNLVVIEIKAASHTSKQDAIETDIKKLIAFRKIAHYEVGILLVFGEHIGRVQEHATQSMAKGLKVDLIELWHHPKPSQLVRKVQWVSGVT